MDHSMAQERKTKIPLRHSNYYELRACSFALLRSRVSLALRFLSPEIEKGTYEQCFFVTGGRCDFQFVFQLWVQ